MSLLQIKKDYEQFFWDNYEETKVHWAGEAFDTSKYDEWVFFEYLGTNIKDNGYDNTDYVHKGQLYICIVADNRFRTMEIADIIIELFKGKKIGNAFVREVFIDGQGIIEDKNKSYIDLNMNISMV